MKRINKVAVLGAGTMGARIAAHFANAGVPSYLFDIVPPDADGPARNKIAAAGLDAVKKSKPAAFMEPSLARLVTVGNFEDDINKLADVDCSTVEQCDERVDSTFYRLARVFWRGSYERSTGMVHLEGGVKVRDSTTTVTCDQASYSEDDDVLRLQGNVVVSDRDAVLRAPWATYDRRGGRADCRRIIRRFSTHPVPRAGVGRFTEAISPQFDPPPAVPAGT